MKLTLMICILGWQGDGDGCLTKSQTLHDATYEQCMARGQRDGSYIGASLAHQGVPTAIGIVCTSAPNNEEPMS